KIDIRDEALTLPESTHSFLFTELVRSVPFVFGVGIAAMSYACLVLALINHLTRGSIPANVDWSVRTAQYLSILVALLMEEEIPTGLFLLKRISKPYLKSKFPEISYPKFVCSSLVRITSGYLFLINVLVVLMQADGVITIFYDCLALQFIQKLDCIGFSVSRMEVLGKRLERATTTRYFHDNFNFKKERGGIGSQVEVALKAAYLINLVVFMAAIIVVSVKQTNGRYQCDSINVRFGEDVWRDAIVQWPTNSKQYPPGLVEEMALVYTHFNGEYAKDPNRTQEGRPVYIEQKKSDRTPFDDTTPPYNPYSPLDPELDVIEPAEIKFCGGHWVFSRPFIQKARNKYGIKGCDWLARSPKTEGFDLLEVEGKWQIWTGVIVESELSIQCNECSDDADCNMNGVCNSDRNCYCDTYDDVVHLGTHCEVKLEKKCRTIIEQYNDTWAVDALTFPAEAWARMAGPTETFMQEYSCPVYSYKGGLPEDQAPSEKDSYSLIYSGSIWFRILLIGARTGNASDFWVWQTANYHVGVDFYHVGEQGNQFGPFGVLIPAQKDNVTGE
ncbi:LOW QUALITY PROTEIN: hypothetical protein ACHAWF_012944, partial [Thalassiosira exigua]